MRRWPGNRRLAAESGTFVRAGSSALLCLSSLRLGTGINIHYSVRRVRCAIVHITQSEAVTVRSTRKKQDRALTELAPGEGGAEMGRGEGKSAHLGRCGL